MIERPSVFYARMGRALPALLVIGLMFVTASPAALPFLMKSPPLVAMAAAFYWGVYRPWYMPAWLLFLLGLLQDVFTASPIGFHALMFLAVRWVAAAQRRAFKTDDFLLGWFGFALVAAGACFAAWLLRGILLQALALDYAPLLQWIVTVAIYPPLVFVFHRLDQEIDEAKP